MEKHCRICLDCTESEDFISPCKCSGTLKYVHRKCLIRWFQERSQYEQFRCEICNTCYLNFESNIRLIDYIGQCFDFRQANRSILTTLILILNLYLLYYMLLSGQLQVVLHSGQVPDMDIFIWKKSDAYAVVCVDQDCRCETDVYNNNNNPKWDHQCEYWKDKSIFIFSRISFLVFDSDIDQNDDFIGEVGINIYQIIFNLLNGKQMQLKWDIPYKCTLIVTVKWTSNLNNIINHFKTYTFSISLKMWLQC